MKRIIYTALLALGLVFLAFLFSGCDKDNNFIDLESQELEMRKKDDCVTVKTGTTIKVALPVPEGMQSPPGPEIQIALDAAIQNAIITEQDPDVREALDSAKVHVPVMGDGISNFLSDPDFVAVTFPYIFYKIVDGKLVVVVINIQVLEEPVSEKTREHEDAHNDIANDIANNDKVAEKAAKDSGKDCDKAGADVTQAIRGVIDNANAKFDEATKNGTKGDQAKEAKKAAKEAVKEYLHPPKGKKKQKK
jgi:hypothetical protein